MVSDPADVASGGDHEPSPADVELAVIRAALGRCLPDAEIRTLEPFGEGDFCRALLLNEVTVVRLPRHARAARALAVEARLLPRIAPLLPLAIPVPSYVECPEVAPGSFSLHRLIEGEGLTRSSWLRLPPGRRESIARDLGSFLRSLHGLDVELARSSVVPSLDPLGRVGLLLRGMARADSPLPPATRGALGAALGRYLAGRPEWSHAPAILHCDVAPGHVLIDPSRGEITGVIDWGDVAIGDPARDFIFLYEDFGLDFLALALEGYEPTHAAQFVHRVHMEYIVDQLEWTLRRGADSAADLAHGVAALERALLDLNDVQRAVDGAGEKE